MTNAVRGGAWLLLLAILAGCASNPADELESREAAQVNTNLGINLLRSGRPEQALERLHKALEYDSRNVEAHWALGIAYARLDEPERANDHYRRAIDLRERPQILNSYGAFLCQRGRVDEAVEYFGRAAKNPQFPGRADALANAGLCLARAGDRGRAEDYFHRALDRNPNHRPALAGLANLNLEIGKPLRARGFFQRLDDASGPGAPLANEWLLLGARIELALQNRAAAATYLRRYNERNPEDSRTLRQLDERWHE